MARLFRSTRYLLALLAIALAFVSASAESKEKVLYSFQGGTSDGAAPAGGVVFDTAGNLYGATTDGGGECPPAQCGTVFQLTPPAKNGGPWTETVLYVFKGNATGDGNTPAGSVIIDSAGNLYGTTGYGGTGNCVLLGTKVGCGTVYELSPPAQKGGAWMETVLYSFQSGKDGYLPNGDLVFDGAGNLYGATMFGGGYGTTCDPFYQYCGSVFELSPPKKQGGTWTEKVLHGFRGGSDGANPNGGLILDRFGAIYGTTFAGGNQGCKLTGSIGCGTAVKLAPPTKKRGGWTETILHRFKSDPDGAEPAAGLVFKANGDLYGTTKGGGDHSGSGTVFRLVPHTDGTWAEHVLYGFQGGNDGTWPQSALIFDAKGDLLGTAAIGGTVGGGTVFRLHPTTGSSWTFADLYDFKGAPDGSYPTGALTLGTDGNSYGTTQDSGTGQACAHLGCGTVFTVRP